MASVRLTRVRRLPPRRAWERLTDWERHADRVPLTRITVTTPPPTGRGTRFTARTGVGRFAFDDPMVVVRWEPPDDHGGGTCRLEKAGPFVLGWAEIEVRPQGTGCAVDWREEVRVRGLPGWFDPVVARCGRWLFGRVLRALLDSPGAAERSG